MEFAIFWVPLVASIPSGGVAIAAWYGGDRTLAIWWGFVGALCFFADHGFAGAATCLGHCQPTKTGLQQLKAAPAPAPLRRTNFRHKHVRALRANAATHIERQRYRLFGINLTSRSMSAATALRARSFDILAITVFTPALSGCLLLLSWLQHRRVTALALWGWGSSPPLSRRRLSSSSAAQSPTFGQSL